MAQGTGPRPDGSSVSARPRPCGPTDARGVENPAIRDGIGDARAGGDGYHRGRMPSNPRQSSSLTTPPPTHLSDLPGPFPPAVEPPPKAWKKWAKRLLVLAAVGFVFGTAGFAGLVWYFSRGLPHFESISEYKPPQTTRVLAADGSLSGEIFAERRTVVPINDIPGVMVQALVSAEDKNFFEHSGIDFLGTIK